MFSLTKGDLSYALYGITPFSDFFSLSKDDLWEALAEYPEARRSLGGGRSGGGGAQQAHDGVRDSAAHAC